MGYRTGDFGLIHVPHRDNVVANLVEGALEITGGFGNVTEVAARMARTPLTERERRYFAEQALRLRYKPEQHVPYAAQRLLDIRRPADQGEDLWHVYNVVQENLMRGGIVGRSALGRLSRTRRISAIREDVRINTALWQLAMSMIRA